MHLKNFKIVPIVLAASLSLATAGFAQTAGQDIKNAGHDTKDATVKAGHATARGTKKAYHKTAHATSVGARKTKNGTKTAAHDTANESRKLTGNPEKPPQ